MLMITTLLLSSLENCVRGITLDLMLLRIKYITDINHFLRGTFLNFLLCIISFSETPRVAKQC